MLETGISSMIHPAEALNATVRGPVAVRGARPFRPIVLLGIMIFVFGEAGSLRAQDIFEIQVYEYMRTIDFISLSS